LKQQVLDMNIPYLRQLPITDPRSTRLKKWEYWTDYTSEGIHRFHKENTPTQGEEKTVDHNMQTENSEKEEETQRGAEGSVHTEGQEQSTRGSAEDREQSTHASGALEEEVSIDSKFAARSQHTTLPKNSPPIADRGYNNVQGHKTVNKFNQRYDRGFTLHKGRPQIQHGLIPRRKQIE
jgi:hypothetical protein